MAKLPVHARFEAYLDSNKWKTHIPEFIDTYRTFLEKRNGYASATYVVPADALLTRARTLFKGLQAEGKSIPADVLVGPVTAAAPPPKAPPLSDNNESGSSISPETLAAIAAAEKAEKAEKARAASVVPKKSAPAPAPAPVVPKKPVPVPPKRPAVPASPPLGAVPREGAVVGAIPGIVPASCGRITPEFVERWVADNYSHLPQGDPYGVRHIDIHPAFNSEFEIKRTVGDGTCLLHSFLTDLSPTYRRMTKKAKETVGAAFRKHIYAMLYSPDARMQIQADDYEAFRSKRSIDAKVIARNNNKFVAEGFEDELYDALARAYIRDTLGYLYDDDIEKLRACFKIRIIIVTQNPDRDYDIFRLGPISPEELAAEFEREREINAENGYTRYIMIYQSGIHFEAVRRRGTDQYIFIYPEVQDIIEASRGTGVDTRGLKELFTQGTPVTVRTEEGGFLELIVGEDRVHFEGVIGDIPQVDQVYLEPADHSVAPQLYPIANIIQVNGRGFRASDYQAAASPGSPRGVRGSPAPSLATPEHASYNGLYPPLHIITSPKRKGKSKGKGTKRKSKSPSSSPPSPPKAKKYTWRKPKANSTAALLKAQAKLAAATAALEKAKKNVESTSATTFKTSKLQRKTKKKESP